jgi:hypothetical protein
MVAIAAVVAVVLLMPVPAAGPTSLSTFVGVAAYAQGFGEPRRSSIERSRAEASGEGAQAPTAKAKTWDPPRLPDGQPDMQGFWGERSVTSYDLEAGFDERHLAITGQRQIQKSSIVDPADGTIPYQPWAAAKKKEIQENHTNPKAEHLDPQARCFLGGVPRLMYQGDYQILQPPGYVVILHEFTHAYRSIPLDGRPPVGGNIQLWMGDSRGRWEGNTLVVDVTNFNDKNWFDVVGSFHSDALHVVERLTFVDADTIHYEATIEDPKVFTRPWKMAFPILRIKEKGHELLEDACYEGNRAVQQILGSSSTKGPSGNN